MWLVDCMEIALSAVNKIFMSNKMEIHLTLGSANFTAQSILIVEYLPLTPLYEDWIIGFTTK